MQAIGRPWLQCPSDWKVRLTRGCAGLLTRGMRTRRGIFDRRIGGPFFGDRLCLLCQSWFLPRGGDVSGRRREGREDIYIVGVGGGEGERGIRK